MTDRERLAALLADLFPVVSRSWWPFTVEQAAEALVQSGVTFASGDRVLGLTIEELRVAVATADQYHPQWRRSLQKPASLHGK